MKPQAGTQASTGQEIWLALMVGNSRLHWARFVGEKLDCAWDTNHLPASVMQQLGDSWALGDLPVEMLPPSQMKAKLTPPLSRGGQNSKSLVPLYLASVVPSQTAFWQTYSDVRLITLDQVPLLGVYPTLGIDRALALWGAGETWGWPVLVIDAGTALTFTGADANRCLIGGAILPGLRLQLRSLEQKTAGLPIVDLPQQLPRRWALNTPTAIQSGVVYTAMAGIRDFVDAWWQEFAQGRITLTGGDSALLLTYLQSQFPEIAVKVIADPHLIFWGIRSCWTYPA